MSRDRENRLLLDARNERVLADLLSARIPKTGARLTKCASLWSAHARVGVGGAARGPESEWLPQTLNSESGVNNLSRPRPPSLTLRHLDILDIDKVSETLFGFAGLGWFKIRRIGWNGNSSWHQVGQTLGTDTKQHSRWKWWITSTRTKLKDRLH